MMKTPGSIASVLNIGAQFGWLAVNMRRFHRLGFPQTRNETPGVVVCDRVILHRSSGHRFVWPRRAV